MNAQQRAVAVSLKATRRVSGVDVVYHRASSATNYTLKAIPGSLDFVEQSDSYTITATRQRDWLIELATIGDVAPGENDYVTETIGDVERRYDLVAESGVKPWRYLAAGTLWIRLHTKLTSESEAVSPTTTEEPTTEEP